MHGASRFTTSQDTQWILIQVISGSGHGHVVMWSCDGVPSKACAVGSRNSPTFLLDQYPDLVAGCSYVLGWCGLPLQETKPTRRSDRVKEDLQ